MNDNSNLIEDLEEIAKLIFLLEKKIKQAHDNHNDMDEASATHLDLTDLDNERHDMEAFRLDIIVPLIKSEKEAEEAAPENDNDDLGRLSDEQMGLKVGRG